jgi:hypothetical protein
MTTGFSKKAGLGHWLAVDPSTLARGGCCLTTERAGGGGSAQSGGGFSHRQKVADLQLWGVSNDASVLFVGGPTVEGKHWLFWPK